MAEAFFKIVNAGELEVLQPLPTSVGGWSADQMKGPAVSAALARATERVADRALPGTRPVRWTVDLFRPAGLMPTAISTTLFRKGRRIGLIDAELSQNGKPIARSRAVFAHPSPTPAGEVWSPERAFPLPPPHLTPLPGEPRIYRTERQGWTPHAKDHLGGTHKQTWHFPVPLVEGEEPTRFQMTAGVADVTNLVSNWGTAGLEFINADITLAITRLPAAMELGLCPIDRTVSDGIAIGTAAVFDRQGQLGLATVVTLANAAHRVDIARSGTGRMPD